MRPIVMLITLAILPWAGRVDAFVLLDQRHVERAWPCPASVET